MVLQSVEPGSPAAKAGIQPGDVVTTVNDHPVKMGSDLVDPIAQTPVGGKVRIIYMRNREQHEATVTVEDRAKLFPDRSASNGDEQAPRPGQTVLAPVDFGLHVEDVAVQRSRRASLQGEHGVIVTEVAPASFAEDLGFIRGDLIQEINHMAVNSSAEFQKSLAALKPGQEVVFKVSRRADNERTLEILLAGVMPAAH
jgi:serine protease Do